MTSPSKNVALSLIHSLFGKLFLIQFLPVPASYPLLLPSRRQNISPDSFDESGVFNKGKCICLLKILVKECGKKLLYLLQSAFSIKVKEFVR